MPSMQPPLAFPTPASLEPGAKRSETKTEAFVDPLLCNGQPPTAPSSGQAPGLMKLFRHLAGPRPSAKEASAKAQLSDSPRTAMAWQQCTCVHMPGTPGSRRTRGSAGKSGTPWSLAGSPAGSGGVVALTPVAKAH